MKKTTSMALFLFLLLGAIGLSLIVPNLDRLLPTDEQDSPGLHIYGDTDALVQVDQKRGIVPDTDTTVSIDIVGAADIDAVLSVSAWAEQSEGRLWEQEIDPSMRLVKRVPPNQNVAIIIPQSQFGESQRRTVNLQPGEDARLVFNMVMPVALDLQLTGMPPEVMAEAFVTVYDADSGDQRFRFQHCRTNATGSVRLAYDKPRMLKAEMRFDSAFYPLKLIDGGEIFSSDIGYAVVGPAEPIPFEMVPANKVSLTLQIENFAQAVDAGVEIVALGLTTCREYVTGPTLTFSLEPGAYFLYWLQDEQHSTTIEQFELISSTSKGLTFTQRGVRDAKIIKPPAGDNILILKRARPNKVFFMSVPTTPKAPAWELVLLERQDYSFAVVEAGPTIKQRLTGFVYVGPEDEIVYPELRGSMGTVQVGDQRSGVTLLAKDRLGNTYEIAHLLPNTRTELWLPELKSGEEFVVAGCSVTHDRLNGILQIERSN